MYYKSVSAGSTNHPEIVMRMVSIEPVAYGRRIAYIIISF